MKYLETAHGNTSALAIQIKDGTIAPVPAPLLNVLNAIEHLQAVAGQPLPGESYQDARQAISDELFTTGSLADGWLDRLLEADRSVERAKQVFASISSWQGSAEWRLKTVLNEHRDDLLDSIRTSLTPVIKRLRDAYRTVGEEMSLDDPDAMAVARASEDVRAALVSISEDTDTYIKLRQAQITVHVAEARPPHSEHGVTWENVRDAGVFELGRVTQLPAYPTPPEGQTWGLRDSVRAVLARPDVRVPSTDQLRQAWTAITRLPEVVEADAETTAKAGVTNLSDVPNHQAWR